MIPSRPSEIALRQTLSTLESKGLLPIGRYLWERRRRTAARDTHVRGLGHGKCNGDGDSDLLVATGPTKLAAFAPR